MRSYAKFLKIADSEWLNVIDFGDEQQNDLGKNARATSSVNQYSSHNRWVGYLTALVVLVVLGMTGMWWWESYQQSNAERDNLVNSYTQFSTETPATVTNVDSVPVVTQPINHVENHVVEPVVAETTVEVKPQENVVATPVVVETEVAPANVLQSEMSKINGTEQVASMPESSSMETAATTTTSSVTESAVENPSESVEGIFEVKNEHGLHARPAAILVSEVKKYNANIAVQNLDRNTPFVSAKSLMKVVALGVVKGHRLRFVATGEQAQQAIEGIGAAINAGLGE